MATGLDAFHYAGASARVRGLYSHLIKPNTWHDLIAARDLASAVALLKTTRYADVISATEQSGVSSLEQIERQLWGWAAEMAYQTMTLTTGDVHSLLLVWWQQFELENLKAVFRGLDQQMDPADIRRFLIPLGEHSTLPWEGLLHEHSVSSVIDHLRDTHYINPLRNAYPVYQREHSVFSLEIALDIRYYRDLAAKIKRLRGSESEEARRVVGFRLDMLNLLWAFRYRFYYGLSAEETVNYTLWQTVRTGAALVRDIAMGANARDVLLRVWGEGVLDLSPLQELESAQGAGDQAAWLPRIELILQRRWRELAMREMSGYPFKLGALLGYLVLQQLEVHDLITLLEGKGMGWEPERIGQHLIRGKE
jgi:V/A-type H+/Na+-transporting ATPase subunit C